MSNTIFYSWQSDSPSNTNRNFIEDALKKAIEAVNKELTVQTPNREDSLSLDKDTQGLPGTPPIVDSIFEKISRSGAFIADLTIVAKTEKGRHIPNPNVLIEYGWALCVLKHARMIPVMNTAFGSDAAEDLPFDMRHLRKPISYNLPVDADGSLRQKAKQSLTADLTAALRVMADHGHFVESAELGEEFQGAATTFNPGTFLSRDEVLTRYRSFSDHREELRIPDVQLAFLRLIPRLPLQDMETSAAVLKRVMEGQLRPMCSTCPGRSHERNSHGAVVYSAIEKEIRLFTQLFKTGEIWGIEAWLIDKAHCTQHSGVDFGYIASAALEETFNTTMQNYLKFAREVLGLRAPVRFVAGITDVKGYRLAPPQGGRFVGSNYGGHIVEDHVLYDGTIDNLEDLPERILRPFYERVWEECGLKRPDSDFLY